MSLFPQLHGVSPHPLRRTARLPPSQACPLSGVRRVAPAAVSAAQLARRPVVAAVLGAAARAGRVGDAEAPRTTAGVADGRALPADGPQDTVAGQKILLGAGDTGQKTLLRAGIPVRKPY